MAFVRCVARSITIMPEDVLLIIFLLASRWLGFQLLLFPGSKSASFDKLRELHRLHCFQIRIGLKRRNEIQRFSKRVEQERPRIWQDLKFTLMQLGRPIKESVDLESQLFELSLLPMFAGFKTFCKFAVHPLGREQLKPKICTDSAGTSTAEDVNKPIENLGGCHDLTEPLEVAYQRNPHLIRPAA